MSDYKRIKEITIILLKAKLNDSKKTCVVVIDNHQSLDVLPKWKIWKLNNNLTEKFE